MTKDFLLKTVPKMSMKPMLSLATYESLDAECVVTGSSDKTIRFLEIGSLDEISRCKVNKKSVNCVAISDMSPEGDEPIIISGGKDNQIQIWDPLESTVEKNIEIPTSDVRSLAIYQGTETYVVIGTKDGKVFVWDVIKDVEIARFVGHKASIHSVLITSFATYTDNDMDHICVASGSADRTVRTWDIVTGKKKKKFRHKRSISSMLIANRGIRPVLATGGVEKLIMLWDVETGVLLRSLEGHLDTINCLSLWEGYEMLIISGSADRTIRVFDILSGECLCILVGHTEAVLGLTIANKEDPVLVSCSDDLSLMEWSLTDIICEFFFTDDENLGCRNENPPYLPQISYVAPAEIDKASTSKEERKRLKKEQKKITRAKAQEAAFGISLESLANEINFEDSEGSEDENEEGWCGRGGNVAAPVVVESEASNEVEVPSASDGNDGVNGDYNNDDGNDNGVASEVLVRSPSATMMTGEEKAGSVTTVAPGLFANKVNPTESGEAEVRIRRKSSIDAVKNVMGKILGLGSASEVGIAPPSAVGTEVSAESQIGEASVPETTTSSSNVPELDINRQAANTVQNFNLAEVESQLEIDQKKKEAADKLKARLNLKKGIFQPKGKGDDKAGNSRDLEKEKAMKLAQYKLQTNRRKESMAFAQNRSKGSLQKRLDEIAEKKKMQANMEAFLEDEDEVDSSDEDD